MKAGRGFLALFAALTAGAIGAPLAHAGSYDVLSCTVAGTAYPNNAWAAGNNPAGDGRYVTDATGHGWRTVKATRTRKGGVYSTRSRFNSARGRFTFRMRLRPNDSYPFARGTSSARRVSVG